APDPTSGSERGRKDQIHLSGRGSRSARRIIGPPDLAQDLGLSQNLGIQTCRYREEMAHRLEPAVPLELGGDRSALLRHLPKPWLQVVVPGPVQFTAVTGGKQKGGPARPA